MLLLLTNDDGVLAPGLHALKKAFCGEKDIDIVVVAPETEKSASSHSLTLHKPLRLQEVQINGGHFGYSCNGTPTDCVLLSVKSLLKKKPDFVISGINRGGNLGGDVTYSGTVSAAMEAAILGIPSFAVSVVGWKVKTFEPAARFAKKLARYLLKGKCLPPYTFLNVNVPNAPQKELCGVAYTRQDVRFYQGELHPRKDLRGKTYYWIGGRTNLENLRKGTDYYAISQKKISITPLYLDLTHHALLKKMSTWKVDRRKL